MKPLPLLTALGALGALAAASLASAPSLAQSVTVIGSGRARACFEAAQWGDTSFGAIEDCDYALQREPLNRRDKVATFVNRGVVRAARAEYQLAFDDYERARELTPDQPEIFLNRGNVYFYAERWTDAIADYDQALELGLRRENIAFLNRGMAREFSGDLAGAEEDYLAALDVLPEWDRAEEKLQRVRRKIEDRRNDGA